MHALAHLFNNSSVSQAVEHLFNLSSAHDEISARLQLIDIRIEELQKRRADYDEKITPIVEPAQDGDIEHLLAGGVLDRPTAKTLENRQQQNSQAGIQVSYVQRDISLLELERTRCNAKLSEIEEQKIEAHAQILSASTDALIEDCQAELKGIAERFLWPLQVLSDYRHFRSKALRGEVRISWHTGLERVQVWPPYDSSRFPDGRHISPAESRDALVLSLLEEYSKTSRNVS